MKIKFTKRSVKDTTLVTMSLAQLDNSDLDFMHRTSAVGDEIIVTVDRVPTVFTLTRPNDKGEPTAATTRGFPRHLRLPQVGRPVYVEVSDIR